MENALHDARAVEISRYFPYSRKLANVNVQKHAKRATVCILNYKWKSVNLKNCNRILEKFSYEPLEYLFLERFHGRCAIVFSSLSLNRQQTIN